MKERIVFTQIEGLSIRTLGAYSGHLGLCIRRLKFHDETYLAAYLAKRLRLALPQTLLLEQKRPSRTRISLMPVPLSPQRLVERGYNQSALIAGHLCRGTALQLDVKSSQRKKPTQRQSDLNRKERHENMKTAFEAKKPRFRGQPVILLDDLITTGSTLLSLCRTLESHHYRVLSAITVAYTPDLEISLRNLTK